MPECESLKRKRSPFDGADADIIFRSADGEDFHLYKVILAKASPVFRGMLTLPDPERRGEPQVVSMSEDADTLNALLQFYYPMEHPVFTSLGKLWPVIVAAEKYEMQFTMVILRQCLRSFKFLRTEPPLRIYAIACLCGLHEIAREAARLLLDKHTTWNSIRSLLSFANYPPSIYLSS
ncbi:hypothetical protein C8T65DRAFT_101247 [Cerioporus squamosus]|nr:hypothetical protein C8T65DRAFT_101247 [Cerioporus squamosus]